ncbi:MAG: sulfatase-like hydrolase/transferase [Phycisphaerales bacterium]|nr:MAG: sulfatase-like hydrolase/transferase [Phycisphaerales bacterium]
MKASNLGRRHFLKAAGLFASALSFSGCTNPPSASESEKPSADRPNILWITCEDINPRLGCYGDTCAITPNLDKLAARAVRYTRAFATAPVCAPSRSCLITGVYATSLGSQHLRSSVKLPPRIKCFPEYLRAAGYYCSNNYKEDYNFTAPNAWNESSPRAHWRKRAPGQPFFSVFNFTSTHQGQINGSDEEFFAKYRSKLEPRERHDPAGITLPPYYPDTPFVRNIWARYYDLITFMDKQVGDLLGQLQADGLADNTIVFFFADHGLGLPRFKRTLYDSGLHVPLLVRFPDKYRHLAPARAGRSTDRLVSFVDFAPTVLSLVGLPVPPYMQGSAFLGPRPGRPREYIFGAASRVDEVYEMSRSVRDKRYKYIRNYMPHLPYIQPSEYPDRAEIMQELRRVAAGGRLTGPQKSWWLPAKPVEELYDTQTDPHEIDNLADAPKHNRTLRRLRKVLRQWIVETRDTGLLPEAEMHIRSAESTPYEMAKKPERYPIQRILAAADLVGKGRAELPELIKLLADGDGAVRYWAALGLAALEKEAAPATEALEESLKDEHPDVRFVAAATLCKLGACEDALPVLAKGLQDPRETVVLRAAREIQGIGPKACPIALQMRKAQARCRNADGAYKNNNHAAFIDWALKYALANCAQ